ncbi:MAG TPA: hypothetical protein VNK04_00710 [Gemmataceae bacterium]|nr:hypothetical protein [Gemmataceae bacterium]
MAINMAINIDDVIQRALEQAFLKALEQTIQQKAEAVFTKAFQDGSPFAQKLQEKIEQGFQRFIAEGIQWEKKKPGFKK